MTLVHGLGEHCGRYDHVAEALNQSNLSVVAFDLRGHGESEGRRGHTPDFDAILSDMFQWLELTRSHYPDVPLFLYGHSLGGSLVIHYTLKQKPDLAGVIATAPLLRLAYDPPSWKTAVLNLLNTLHIQCGLASELDETAISRDINVVRTYRNDPLTHDRITPAMAAHMLTAGAWNIQHAADFPCPLLLMHGDQDRITSAEASQQFAERAGAICTSRSWKGLYHELHNEPEKGEVLNDALEWINEVMNGIL